MKYAIFAFEGNSFPIAKRLKEEGCEVYVGQVEDMRLTQTPYERKSHVTEDKEEKKLRWKGYRNIILKMSADKLLTFLFAQKHPEEFFVFFESNNLFYYAEKLQGKGFQGNFVTQSDREFEIDRNFSKEFVKKHYPSLKIAKKKSFQTIADAYTFLSKTKDVWVLKSQTDAIPTLVPQTNNVSLAKKQLLETLSLFQKGYEGSGFILEKKITEFIEITPEKIYYDGVPLALTMNFENKFFGSGNLSMQVGCAGDLIFPIAMDSKIHDIAFPKIVDEMAKKHQGLFIWDASLLIDKNTKEIYFGEFCSNRPGYNSIFTEIEQTPSVHSFFESMVQGKNPFVLGTVAASLMIFTIMRNDEGALLPDISVTISKKAQPHVWAYDMYQSLDGSTKTVGYDMLFAPVTGSGRTISEAVDALYKNVAGVELQNMYYRPQFDFLSRDYPTSILNRLDFSIKQKYFSLPFPYESF